ncbi:MAG: hypothetical protein HQL19_00875 [Candidatus Omnitrophica bacterium]|nr:hypothetical protein [Candidatus Omnitrophota bacterium]
MRNLSNKKGFALVFSLAFLLLTVSSVALLFSTVTGGLTLTRKAMDLKRAYYLADAGLAEAFIALKNNPNPPMIFRVGESNYVIGGSKTGSYAVTVQGSGATWIQYTLTSVGTYNGVSKTLILKVQQSALSTYAYFSNTEINPTFGRLWWITGMTTVGPVRTNGQLNLWGKPIFDGPVTQSNPTINYWNGADNSPDFVDGVIYDPATLALPAAMLNNISAEASSSGLILSGDSAIVFHSDGTMNVTNAANGWSNHSMWIPSNGVIYVQNGTPTVEGTIKGRVTVASEGDIYVSGNLMYDKDPRTDPTSTDLLGLVAKNNVTVTAQSAPTNLELDAVIVAINGAFQVDQWWLGGKGNMVQYGSLINNYCGPTGIFDPSSGTLYGGYNQLQYYDSRLKTIIPPGFPVAVNSNGKILYVKTSFQEL